MADVLVEKGEALIALALSEQEAKNLAGWLGSRRSSSAPYTTLPIFMELARGLKGAGIDYSQEYDAVIDAQDRYLDALVECRVSRLPKCNPFEQAVGKEVVVLASNKLDKDWHGRRGTIIGRNERAYAWDVKIDGDPGDPLAVNRDEIAVVG